MADTWTPYDLGHWNPGERDHAYIGDVIADFLAGNRTERPLAVVDLNETANLIDRGVMVRRIEKAGFGFIPGPSGVPDGKKLAMAFNPAIVAPVGERINIKTYDAYMGSRNGRKTKFRMGNRYQLGQEFEHLPSGGRSPIHFTGHTVPSVNRNMRQVRGDNANTAKVISKHKGALVLFKDWNFDLTSGSGAKLRHDFLRDFDGYTITNGWSKRFEHTGTWANREIDWAVVREGLGFKIVGKEVHKIKGHERGGAVGHKFVVLSTELKARQ